MQGKRMSKGWKTFAIWCTLILLFFAFFSFFRNQPRSDPWRTTQAFKTDLEANRIESVTPGRGFLVVTDDEGERYRVPGVLDGSLWKDLASHGVRVGAPATDQSSSAWPSFLTSWLPLLALVAVFVFLMRKMGGAQSIFALRKTTARLANTPSATFPHPGGAGERKGVIVVAATNRADILDAALLRPGRFDVRLKMPPLSQQGRAEVLSIHLQNKPVAGSVERTALAAETEGFSGAELESLVNEAA